MARFIISIYINQIYIIDGENEFINFVKTDCCEKYFQNFICLFGNFPIDIM